jgi:transaldolase
LEESDIKGYFTKLSDSGFDMNKVYRQLLKEGLEAFEKAFQEMLDSLK